MAADKFLRTLYCIQAKSGKEDQMITYLETVIPKLGSNIKVETIDRNIYVTKGEADNYPCICAHTDLVYTWFV